MRIASFVNADPVRYCVTDEEKVCFTVGIPDSTASSGGGGDIYIQIQGPSTMQWIGLGQGNMMRGANMFIIYADPTETNVTLSGRRATGHSEPQVARDASVFLLDGSGIKDGVMTANIRCKLIADLSQLPLFYIFFFSSGIKKSLPNKGQRPGFEIQVG